MKRLYKVLTMLSVMLLFGNALTSVSEVYASQKSNVQSTTAGVQAKKIENDNNLKLLNEISTQYEKTNFHVVGMQVDQTGLVTESFTALKNNLTVKAVSGLVNDSNQVYTQLTLYRGHQKVNVKTVLGTIVGDSQNKPELNMKINGSSKEYRSRLSMSPVSNGAISISKLNSMVNSAGKLTAAGAVAAAPYLISAAIVGTVAYGAYKVYNAQSPSKTYTVNLPLAKGSKTYASAQHYDLEKIQITELNQVRRLTNEAKKAKKSISSGKKVSFKSVEAQGNALLKSTKKFNQLANSMKPTMKGIDNLNFPNFSGIASKGASTNRKAMNLVSSIKDLKRANKKLNKLSFVSFEKTATRAEKAATKANNNINKSGINKERKKINKAVDKFVTGMKVLDKEMKSSKKDLDTNHAASVKRVKKDAPFFDITKIAVSRPLYNSSTGQVTISGKLSHSGTVKYMKGAETARTVKTDTNGNFVFNIALDANQGVTLYGSIPNTKQTVYMDSDDLHFGLGDGIIIDSKYQQALFKTIKTNVPKVDPIPNGKNVRVTGISLSNATIRIVHNGKTLTGTANSKGVFAIPVSNVKAGSNFSVTAQGRKTYQKTYAKSASVNVKARGRAKSKGNANRQAKSNTQKKKIAAANRAQTQARRRAAKRAQQQRHSDRKNTQKSKIEKAKKAARARAIAKKEKSFQLAAAHMTVKQLEKNRPEGWILNFGKKGQVTMSKPSDIKRNQELIRKIAKRTGKSVRKVKRENPSLKHAVRLRIDPADSVTEYNHIEIWNRNGQSLNKLGKVVKRTSKDAHMPYKFKLPKNKTSAPKKASGPKKVPKKRRK